MQKKTPTIFFRTTSRQGDSIEASHLKHPIEPFCIAWELCLMDFQKTIFANFFRILHTISEIYGAIQKNFMAQ